MADAHGSDPCERNLVQVQVLLPVPNKKIILIIIKFSQKCK